MNVVEFFKPTTGKVIVFFVILLGLNILIATLSMSGQLYSYTSCTATKDGVSCGVVNYLVLGLPSFYIGERMLGEFLIPAKFLPEMFALNIVLWYFVACWIHLAITTSAEIGALE